MAPRDAYDYAVQKLKQPRRRERCGYSSVVPVNNLKAPTTPVPTVVGGTERRTAEVDPITDADVPAVADFLHARLNNRVPPSTWATGMSAPWRVNAPNHGFMLRDGQRIVGAHLAFYSERII